MEDKLVRKENGDIGEPKSIGMVCNNCMVSSNCPQYKPDSSCTIDFNAVFTKMGKSNEAIKVSALDIIALQNERVHRAAHQERLNFGTLDPNLSSEISRYFELLGNYKKLGEKKDKISIEAEGQQSLGLLSKLLADVNKST